MMAYREVERLVQPHDFNPHDVHALMRELKSLCESAPRDSAPKASAAQALQRHLEGFEGKLNLVLAEHEGMANELLQAFEQLGVVFEVTRRLASVKEEGEALRLFIDSLRPMFPHCQVLTVRGLTPSPAQDLAVRAEKGSDPLGCAPDTAARELSGAERDLRGLTPFLAAVVRECRTERRVVDYDA
jgi:hypothetical protein